MVKICFTLIIAIISLLCFESFGLAAQRNCTDLEEKKADKLLFLSHEEQKASIDMHLPWGLPISSNQATNEKLLVNHEYIIKYDEDILVPIWTAYRLTKDDIVKADRVDCFRRDPRVTSSEFPTPKDYKEPVYDQGHMTPRAAMNRSLMAVINTYVMTNMTPQHADFNRHVWRRVETLVRGWAKKKGAIQVITGSVFDHNLDGKRDSDEVVKRVPTGRVGVPSHLYKIVLHETDNGKIESITLLLPNWPWKPRKRGSEKLSEKIDKYLKANITSIKEVESLTGIDYKVIGSLAQIKAIKNAKGEALW